MTSQSQPRRSFWPTLPHWSWFVLLGLVLGYWLLMAWLERVNAHLLLAHYLMPELTPFQAQATDFSPLVLLMVRLLHPRVLRHVIPLLVGWWLAGQASISLIQVLYNTADRRAAAEFLRRQHSGRVVYRDVSPDVPPEKLAKERDGSIFLSAGGPTWVRIPDGYIGVTEHNARFQRMLPPGDYILQRFERLADMIDSRLRKSTGHAPVLTKEGLPVSADISLTFSLASGEESAAARSFTFDESAVKQAAYSDVIGANGKASSWVDVPLNMARAKLAEEVGRQTMDDIFTPATEANMIVQTINNVEKLLWKDLPEKQIQPKTLDIRLSPPKEVSHQYREGWEARQPREDASPRPDEAAARAQDAANARDEATSEMLQAFLSGIHSRKQEAGDTLSDYQIAIHLLGALREVTESSRNTLSGMGNDGSAQEILSRIDSAGVRLADLESRLQLPSAKFVPSRPD